MVKYSWKWLSSSLTGSGFKRHIVVSGESVAWALACNLAACACGCYLYFHTGTCWTWASFMSASFTSKQRQQLTVSHGKRQQQQQQFTGRLGKQQQQQQQLTRSRSRQQQQQQFTGRLCKQQQQLTGSLSRQLQQLIGSLAKQQQQQRLIGSLIHQSPTAAAAVAYWKPCGRSMHSLWLKYWAANLTWDSLGKMLVFKEAYMEWSYM